MKRANVQDDIRPMSEFRTHMAELVEHTKKTGRPLILTQRGRSVAVVMSPRDYEALTYREEFIKAVQEGEAELDAGLGIPHEQAMASVKKELASRIEQMKAQRSVKRRKAAKA